MGKGSSIEWTDHTFNPWWGCIRVSPGCEHCYAETFAKRTGHAVWGPAKTTERRLFGAKHWAEPLRWNAAAKKAGERARVFCASMADVFEDHPALDAEREKLWTLIETTPWLDWQLLTKRPENVERMVPRFWLGGFPFNVWLGTSVEDQQRADERIPFLVEHRDRATVLFLSCEPILGPVDLARRAAAHLDWVIIGGESGPGARPMDLAWARSIVAQCREAGSAPFVKQLGARATMNYYDWRDVAEHDGRRVYVTTRGGTYEHREPTGRADNDGQPPLDAWVRLRLRDAKGGDMDEWPEDLRVREMPSEQREMRADVGDKS